MFEKVEIGDTTLYLGDCREIVPSLKADVGVLLRAWSSARFTERIGFQPGLKMSEFYSSRFLKGTAGEPAHPVVMDAKRLGNLAMLSHPLTDRFPSLFDTLFYAHGVDIKVACCYYNITETEDAPMTDIQSIIARQQQDKARIAAIGPKAPPRKKREAGKLSKPQQAAVRELVLSELRACYRDIQNKRRETPAWHRGYDSALSAIEARIAAFEGAK